MSVILGDGWLITVNRCHEVLEEASVYVVRDVIAGIGSKRQLVAAHPEAEVIDCAGRIIMPGMVNTHTRLFQTLLKGLGDDMELKRWFTCMTGPSAVHLTRQDAKVAALHGCAESIRSGVTTLVDFMYVHTQPGMTAAVVEAFEETGMRGFVCRGFMSTGQQHGVPAELIEEPGHAIADARDNSKPEQAGRSRPGRRRPVHDLDGRREGASPDPRPRRRGARPRHHARG